MRMALQRRGSGAGLPCPARHMPTRRLRVPGIGTDVSRIVFVVEGEKDVAPLRGLGLRPSRERQRPGLPGTVGGARSLTLAARTEAGRAARNSCCTPRGVETDGPSEDIRTRFPTALLVFDHASYVPRET